MEEYDVKERQKGKGGWDIGRGRRGHFGRKVGFGDRGW